MEPAGVAQSVEQLICNQQAGGSIPPASSILFVKRYFDRGDNMAFFHEGDVVTVRNDLVTENMYYSDDQEFFDTFVDDMAQLKGKRVTIDRVFELTGKYEIREDINEYLWTDEMFVEYIERTSAEEEIELPTDEELLSFAFSE